MKLLDAEQLARTLITQHLSETGRLWSFGWDYKTRRRLGCCHYLKSRISLSSWYVEHNDESLVLDTILHEIAHALAFHWYGEKGHGPRWASYCVKLGCRPQTCWKQAVAPQRQFRAICQQCGRTYHKPMMPNPRRRYYCRCSGQTLVFLANADYNPTSIAADGSNEVKMLLSELATTYDTHAKKKIRARLRKLGHKGGLR